MKVFISWSGDVSRELALLLRDWLPSVIQSLHPFVSSEDIDKGARWSSDIAEELNQSNYGILCVTPENLGAPWLNFEAGALSKSFDTSRVSPILFGLKRTDITGPLVQFQSTLAEKPDMLKLLHSLNSAGPEPLESARLDDIFDVWWRRLEDKLKEVEQRLQPTAPSHSPRTSRSRDDLLNEVLELVRSQQKLLNSPEKLLPADYVRRTINRPVRDTHPVYADLVGTWVRVEGLLENVDSGDPAVLEELFRELRLVGDIIRYISRRTLGHTRTRSYFGSSTDRPSPVRSPQELTEAIEESLLENEG